MAGLKVHAGRAATAAATALLAAGLVATVLHSPSALAFGGRDRLELCQVQAGEGASEATSDGDGGRGRGKGGRSKSEGSGDSQTSAGSGNGNRSADGDNAALRRLLWEIEKRTSIEVQPEATSVRLTEGAAAELHRHPLLYWTGDRAFAMPSDDQLARLRRHLVMGGMLILDSAEGRAGGGFDQSVRAMVARLFPNQALTRLPDDHVLYRSFYLLRVPAGRVIAQPYLEAVLIGGAGVGAGGAGSGAGSSTSGSGAARPAASGAAAAVGASLPMAGSSGSSEPRAVIVYSQNDLGGAWARDRFGQWLHEVVPGGEAQREQAFRMGVNLVMYALCLDYKADQVHVPFIMRRRMWQAPMPKLTPDEPTPGVGGP